MSGPIRILQGPQRPTRHVGAAVASAELPEGPLAVISAGWQEAEGDLDELTELVGRPLVDLGLYERAEALFRADDGLREAYRERQDRLMQVQRLYRQRLRALAEAARSMLEADVPSEFLAPEVRHAFDQLRALDRHHLGRTETMQQAFTTRYAPATHDGLAAEAEAIRELLAPCAGVIVTGGNVLILLNRMQLFGMDELLREKPIIAWSAGTMVLAERVVLYHDRTPGRRREAEIMGAGLGLLPNFVFLPDGRHRLQADDPGLIQLMSRRFAPATCAVLDNGSTLRFEGERLVGAAQARRLARMGDVREFGAG